MHVDVTEGDVVHETTSDGANGHADPAGADPLKQHVLGVVLHRNTVILNGGRNSYLCQIFHGNHFPSPLIPNSAVVDPNVPPRDIEAVRVERCQVYDIVVVL